MSLKFCPCHYVTLPGVLHFPRLFSEEFLWKTFVLPQVGPPLKIKEKLFGLDIIVISLECVAYHSPCIMTTQCRVNL